jgi:hypothetical protein
MENQEYKKNIFVKASVITGSVLAVIAFVYVIGFLNKVEPLPEKFQAGYKKVALESGEISEIVNLIAKNIREVNDMDLNNETDGALDLIQETNKKNKEAYEKSVGLIDDLESITRVALEIDSKKQKQKALEAIQAEVYLVKELVGYTSKIESFLQSLSVAIVSNKEADRLLVQKSLEEVNTKRETINNLNSIFLAKLNQLGVFD